MNLWLWLAQPGIPVDSLERKRQINLLAWSLLGLMLLGVLLTIMPFVLEPVNYRADDPVNVISAATLVVLLAAYWLNRRGHYTVAASVTMTIIIAAILTATTTNPPDSYDILNYMIIPVLFASILLPLRANVILVAGCIGLMLLIAATAQIDDGMFTVPVLFFSIISLLTLLIMRNRDLVEQDRQSTLAESEERFRKIFLEAPMGMAIIDKDKRFVRVNAHLCNMLGYTMPELQSLTLSDVMRREDGQNDDTPNSRQPIISVEQQCLTKNGSTLWIMLTASLIHEKNVGYGLLMIENITRRKQVEEQARKSESLLNELAKQREMTDFQSRFLTAVSHEFRTPLTAILSSSELLELYHERLAPHARVEGFKRINTEVLRLNQMVDDLLDISRGESGQIKFNPHPLDLVHFGATIVQEMKSIGREHNLIFTHSGDLGSILADTNLLRPALTNLIANAIKYTPQGGDVRVDARLEAGDVVISVTDEGIGIPANDQQRIFEPFYRGENVGTIKGTGLGLRIVQDYVNLHGGSISFTSEQGAGTTFTIRLPAAVALTH